MSAYRFDPNQAATMEAGPAATLRPRRPWFGLWPEGRPAEHTATAERVAPVERAAPLPGLTVPVLDWSQVGAGLWRWRVAILLCGALGGLLGTAYALTQPDWYVATSELLLDPRDLRVVDNDVRPQDTSSTDDTYVEDQARILSSASLLRQIVEQQHLAQDPEFAGGPGGLLARLGLESGTAQPDADLAEARAVDTLAKNLTVARSSRSMLLDVAVRSLDRAKAARLANALVDAYLRQDAAVRSSTAGRASADLDRRLADLRGRVRAAEGAVERFKRGAGLVSANGHDVSEDQVSAVSALVTAAAGRTAEARARLNALRTISPDADGVGAVPDEARSGTLGSLLLSLASARQQQADLENQLGPRHPGLRALRARVTQARADVKAELDREVAGAQADLGSAQASQADLQGQLDALRSRSFDLGDKGVELRELQREADANRSVYETFLLRTRQTGELTSVNTSNTRVVAEAMPPLDKAGPGRTGMMLTGALLGLLIGAVTFGLRSMHRRA